MRGISRRKFIGTTGLFLAATALKVNATDLNEVEPVIDIHQHTHYLKRSAKDLLIHQREMGITTTILLPAGHSANTVATHHGTANDLEAKARGNRSCESFARKHPREFLFGANEVPDLPGALKEIEKYLQRGAVVIGELKFGVDCDGPEMQKFYQLAQDYQVPVLMHWQFERFNYGLERLHMMLVKYPKVNFIGHAQTWWANIDKAYTDQKVLYPKGKVTPGGITDRLLSDFPNIYGDLSAGSGLNAMLRDEDHARDFLQRHQDKLMFGSDCADGNGLDHSLCQGAQTIATLRRLSPDKQIERKLLYHNARRVFRLEDQRRQRL